MIMNGSNPIFSNVICDLKEQMDKSGGSAHLMAAYVFGGVWNRSENNIFSGTKSDLAKELCVDYKTLDKYLAILVELDYLCQPTDLNVYQVSKSVQYRLTINASVPHVDNSPLTMEHVPNLAPMEHVPNVGTCSRDFREHVPTAPPIIYNSNNSNNHVGSISTEKYDQIREIWKGLGLNVGKAFRNTLNEWGDDGPGLIEICAAWLDFALDHPDEYKAIDVPYVVWHIQNHKYPPKSQAAKRWFDGNEHIFDEPDQAEPYIVDGEEIQIDGSLYKIGLI